jgi:hypothetical protein
LAISSRSFDEKTGFLPQKNGIFGMPASKRRVKTALNGILKLTKTAHNCIFLVNYKVNTNGCERRSKGLFAMGNIKSKAN